MRQPRDKLKIGYWLGNINVESGGVALYAWRMLTFLLEHSNEEDFELVIITSSGNEKVLSEKISESSCKARICIIPEKLGPVDKIMTQIDKVVVKSLKKMNVYRSEFRFFSPWFRFVKSLDTDLLHFPYQTPPGHDCDLPCPFTVTMHDVQELHHPEFFTPQERANRAIFFWRALEASSSIVVSFDHVKRDLIKFFKLPDSKIFVCPLPYQTVQLKQPTVEEEESYIKKYSNCENFLLYPAQTWQHKNHIALIDAVEYIKDKYARLIHVVCTGRKTIDFFPTIHEHLMKTKVANQFSFVDVVPEEELFWLYKNCSLVVIPTLYEAGSFPLLEAMYLEAPVICSCVTSLPETINDERFIFNPLNTEEMANLMINTLNNSELSAANIENGKKRAKELMHVSPFPAIINAWKNVIAKS